MSGRKSREAPIIGFHRHGGIELPVYDAAGVLMTRGQIRRRTTVRSAESIIRRIKGVIVGGDAPIDLADCLGTSSETFTRIAMQCGATVLEHEWALYPSDNGRSSVRHTLNDSTEVDLLPHDFGLAARVKVLHGSSELSGDDYERVDDLLNIHFYDQDSRFRWNDSDPAQFLMSTAGVTLVDIDPYFAIRNNRYGSDR